MGSYLGIQGKNLHFIDESGTQKFFLGESVEDKRSMIWLDGQYIKYYDETFTTRQIDIESIDTNTLGQIVTLLTKNSYQFEEEILMHSDFRDYNDHNDHRDSDDDQ